MTFEQQEFLSQMLYAAIVNKNDGEALNALRGFAKKVKAAGVDLENIGVFDTSKGSSTAAGSAAVKAKREFEAAMGVVLEKQRDTCSRISNLRKGYHVSTNGGVTISNGAENVGQTKVWMKAQIKQAGEGGISREDLRALDPSNKGIGRRFSEIIWNEGVVFEVNGKLIHRDYRNYYEIEWAEFIIAREKYLTQGGK